jgi:hypothetical protein
VEWVNTTFIDSDINGVGEYDLHRLIGGRRGRDRMVVGFLNLDQGKVYNIMCVCLMVFNATYLTIFYLTQQYFN